MKKFTLSLFWLFCSGTTLFAQSECQQVDLSININGSFGGAMLYSIEGSNGFFVTGGNDNGSTTINMSYCLPSDCYSIVLSNTSNNDSSFAIIQITSLGQELLNAAYQPGSEGYYYFGVNSPGCGNPVVSGCTDPAALNYNPEAVIDSGTCEYSSLCPNGGVPGTFYLCTFSNGNNVAIQIESDEGAILFEQTGFANGTIMYIPVCIDPNACYTVNMSNSAGELGWYNGYWWLNNANGQIATNSLDNNLNSEVSYFSLNNSCAPVIIAGCTSLGASNYNPDATIDDGSCVTQESCDGNWANITVNGGSFLNEVNWTIVGSNGFSITGGAPYSGNVCIPDDCYTISLNDTWGDGWNGSFMTITRNNAVLFSNTLFDGNTINYAFGLNTEVCEVEQIPIYGCLDPSALNYNAFATVENNSCIYPFVCENGVPAHLYLCAFSNAAELSLEIVGSDGSVVFSQQGFNNLQILNTDLCLDPTICYTATMSNLNGNSSWYNGYWWLNYNNVQIVYNESLNEGSVSEDIVFGLSGLCGNNVDIYGCTDPNALNYIAFATVDDGSCFYPYDCNAAFDVIADSNGQDIFWIVTDFGELANNFSYVWSFGDMNSNFSYEQFPNFTYTEDGDYLLCLTIYQLDSSGFVSCQDSVCFLLSSLVFDNGGGGGIQEMEGFTINVIDASELGVSITENSSSTLLNAFPNPTTGILNLKIGNAVNSSTQIQVLDLNGRVVHRKNYNSIGAGNNIQIDMSTFASGIYMLQLISNEGILTQKIIKD